MNDFPIGSANASSVPAADVTAPPVDTGSIVSQAFPLRQAEEDANEILVRVRGSNLRRVRKRLQSLATGNPFPWAEFLLGIAMLAIGGALGALASDIPWAVVAGEEVHTNWKAILFYVVSPAVGVGCFVAFSFLRHHSARNAASIAETLLEDLPDPDRAL